MVSEILLVLFYTLFCLKVSPKVIIYSIFLLLPLHGFVKTVIFNDSGAIFTIWKEIGIIIALYKTRKVQGNGTRILNKTIIIYILIIIFYLLIGVNNNYSYTGDIRKFIFPIPLFYLVLKIKFNLHDIKKLIYYIFLGSIIINITGVIDFISPSLRLIMRTIMGVEYEISPDGTIYYNITSFKIMGMDRVCGFMGGGPNMMGVFNAAIFLIAVLAYTKELFTKNKEIIIFFITFTLCSFNLLLSFSRAGWALVGITFCYMAITNQKYRKLAIKSLSVISIIGIIAYYSLDIVQKVINGTLSGDEASSAERGNMTRSALDYLLNNPFGYGLGATTRDTDNYVYFAESSIINLGITTGVLGVIVYSLLLYIIFYLTKRNKQSPFMLIAPGFIIAFYITAWVSVNMVENPFLYYAWLIMGLGLNKYLANGKSSYIK